MKSRFNVISVIAVTGIAFLFLSVNTLWGQEKSKHTFRIAESAGVISYAEGVKKFVNIINQKTKGRIEIVPYIGTLGGEKQFVEGLRMGTLDLAFCGMTSYPPADMVYAPYMFRDAEHMFKVVRGPIGDKWHKEMFEKWGIYVIGVAYGSTRNITSNKPIRNLDDMKGFKIRVPEMPMVVAAFKAMGASPTPMAWPEVYTALQQGVIDGQENPLTLIVGAKFYEVQKYFSFTQHAYPTRTFMMSRKAWEQLSDEDKATFENTWGECGKWIMEDVKSNDDKYLNILKENGVEIIYPDQEPFRKAALPAVKEVADKIWGPGVFEEVQNTK